MVEFIHGSIPRMPYREIEHAYFSKRTNVVVSAFTIYPRTFMYVYLISKFCATFLKEFAEILNMYKKLYFQQSALV